MIKNSLRFIFGALLCILTYNTIQKTHICDHEPAIPENETIIVTDEVLNRFIKGLEFPTISDESKEINEEPFREFWKFIEQDYEIIFSNKNFHVKWVNEITLILKVTGTNKKLKPGLFLAHSDVVPAIKEQWTSDPYTVKNDGEYIQARGAYDNKVMIFAHLEAIREMILREKTFERDIFWIFPHDEEIGGKAIQAAAKVLQSEYNIGENGFEFIVDEGTPATNKLVPGLKDIWFLTMGYTAKGHLQVELTVDFRGTGHASIPGKETSITILSKAVNNLATKLQPNQFGNSLEYTTVESLAPYVPFPANVILSNLWLFSPLVAQLANYDHIMSAMMRTTTAITILDAGYKSNVIPVTSRAVLDLRIHPAQTVAQAMEHMRRVVDDPRVKFNIYGEASEPDKVTPVDSIIGKKIINSIHRTMTNTVAVPSIFLAVADSRHLLKFSDQIFRFQPMKLDKEDIKGIHGPDERVRISSFQTSINFLYDFYNHLSDTIDNSHIQREL